MKNQQALLALLSLVFMITILSCNHGKPKDKTPETAAPIVKTDTVNLDQAQKDLLKKDVEFSDYSITNGVSAALLNFIDNDAVLLLPNHRPVVGVDSITAMMNKRKNKKDKIVLSPIAATVASSGDLGYDYGTYTFTQTRKIDGAEMTSNGSYMSEWKKDKTGAWKLVLYTNTDGLVPLKKPKMP